MDTKLHIGYTGSYINDYNARHVCEIPERVARTWQDCVITLDTDGNLVGGFNMQTWINKGFVIVGRDYNKWIAIYRKEDTFALYTIEEEYYE